MFKRFFVAMILGLLVMSSQIVSATDFDWSKAKRIGTKAEFARYIESERRKGNTTFHVVLTNIHAFGLYTIDDFNNYDFTRLTPCRKPHLYGNMYEDSGTAQITFEMTEYPGTRVANAYLSRNQQQAWMNLSAEEKLLYSEAVGIVDEANKRLSEEEKAKYIYQRIREIAHYQSFANPDAIGALVKKVTNCEGFTDTFYLLGRMCNLNVGKINGTAIDGHGQWGGHGWNWITFSDGKSYCVDVTHGIFKATYEDIKNNHWCEWEIIPNMQ